MRVCFVAEGCYPYVVGGVSSWIHSMIRSNPDVEFLVQSVLPSRAMRGKFAYELPDNLSEVHEVYLDDADWSHSRKTGRRLRLTGREREAIRAMILGENVEWEVLFRLFHGRRISIDDFLMGADFLKIASDYYDQSYPEITFSDFLWTLRSIYLPLCFVLNMEVPKADIYHCSCLLYTSDAADD